MRYRFPGFEEREELVRHLGVVFQPVKVFNEMLRTFRALCRATWEEDRAGAYRMYGSLLDDVIERLKERVNQRGPQAA